jgi:hypothetical protein
VLSDVEARLMFLAHSLQYLSTNVAPGIANMTAFVAGKWQLIQNFCSLRSTLNDSILLNFFSSMNSQIYVDHWSIISERIWFYVFYIPSMTSRPHFRINPDRETRKQLLKFVYDVGIFVIFTLVKSMNLDAWNVRFEDI